ncbi:hypothetical protein FACS189418_5840 [Clostridia bacterium]|nr:hypothetical protein FACS189418_5840 [Clostridia bacterium]
MEVNYKRRANKNFMVLSVSEEISPFLYQIRMLEENPIKGLLKFTYQPKEQHAEYYYEISSKQPLKRIVEYKGFGQNELRNLLIGLSTLVKGLENYLLDGNGLLLEAEHIYLAPADTSMYFCYVPGIFTDFSESIRQLFQFFLNKMDYQNKEQVALMYRLYQETMKENYHIEDLLLCFGSQVKKEEQQEWKQEEKKENDEGQDNKKQAKIISYSGWKNWIKEHIFEKKENFDQKEKIDYLKTYALKEENTYQPYSQERSSTEDVHTILMQSSLVQQTKGIRLQSCMTHITSDILVEHFPFVIGQSQEGVDYTIPHPAISRFHICIDKDGDAYQVTDLNSTNGSKLNQQVLITNEKTVLREGDCLELAGLEFIVYFI